MGVKLERLQLLHGHTSPETAYVVNDYPYGFRLRCKIRYWIETAEKGAKKGHRRFVSQTTNPKRPGEVWNAPKASTYERLAWLYLDGESHVQWTGVGYWVSPQQYDRYRLNGVHEQMPYDDRRFYDALVAMSRKGNATDWRQWDEVVGLVVDHIQAHGEPPASESGSSMVLGGRLRYVGDSGLVTAVAYDRLAQS